MALRRDVVQWLGATSLGFAVPLLTGTGCKREISINKSPPASGSKAPKVPSPPVPGETTASGLMTPAPQVRKPIAGFTIRRAADRGRFDFGWLKANHSFSFGRYYDPKHMGFRALRVINEDFIAAGAGFPMHPHNNMEIITYIIDGALQHRDSLGNGSVIRPGEIQRMSAGTGIRHSEFNPSSMTPTHSLQIWIRPDKRGHKPSYAQQLIPQVSSPDPVRLIASPDGFNHSISLHQDMRLYACQMARGQELAFEVREGRHAWLQMARGNITLKGQIIRQGDGVSTSDDGWIMAYANEPTELLIFDLA